MQGSLRQFLTNANALNSNETMRFVPAAPTNATLAGNNWWRFDVSAALPAVDDNQTTIDGTAYQLDGITLDSSNSATLGVGGNVGVGADGIAGTGDEVPLGQLPGPELEISDTANVLAGLEVQAANAIIRNIAITGFGNAVDAPNHGNIVINSAAATNALITQNVIGSGAGAFADPGVGVRTNGVNVRGQDGNGIISNNLIGFSRSQGIKAISNGWLIKGNEIRGNAIGESHIDGIGTHGDSITVEENLVIDNDGVGIDSYSSGGSNTYRNNTVIGNGKGNVNSLTLPDETAGIRVFGDSTLVEFNEVTGNYGAGILVALAATNVKISKNSTFDNGTSLNKGGAGPSGQIGIDLVETGHTDESGSPSPFVTPNAATVGGNGLFDFPVFTSAQIVGPNLEVRGTSVAAAVIEVYISDSDPSGHGEGQTYLFSAAEGSGGDLDPAAGSFYFQVPTPAGVSIGTELTATATATPAAGPTSEFSAVATVAMAGSISGTVFEDVDGNVLDGGEAIGDLNNPTVNGVNIRLYNDDGGTPNQPDATDTLRAGPIATAGAGAYNFASLPNGIYWVVVDSRSVSPAAGINASYLATTPWAEQTFAPDKGRCADGSGGTTERTGAGPCYGGADGATDDDVAALTSSEHVARVVVSGGSVANVDFGFSYNVVTNVEPAGNASLTASTYQGSLDQFVRNANSINGVNAMRFVPAVPTNGAGGGGTWWRVDYTGSIASETLTYVHDAGTSINGTAYDLADGTTVRNANPGNLGANAAGGLTVGVTLVPLPQVARPELELMRSDSGIGDGVHFESNLATGQTPSQFAVRDMSIWGFDTGIAMTGVPAAPVTGITLERNVIGSAPDAFVDPGVANALRGVFVASTTNTSVINNLIGFLDNDGVTASAVTTTAVTGNEIREVGQVDTVADGINYGGGSATGILTGNLIVDSGGMGVDGTSIGNLVADNTITGSGQRGVQTAGVRQNGTTNLVRGNIISGSAGPGVIVPDIVTDITVTQNNFSGNGSIAIDLVASGADTATGDGIMQNDGATDSNDGNDGLDYPIIDGASLSGGNLTVTGYARAGVTIEFYEAVGAANDNNTSGDPHGEGVVYLFTLR